MVGYGEVRPRAGSAATRMLISLVWPT